MTDIPNTSRRIEVLRDSIAQKIAAGEVIDRPYSIVRELLDNALDADSHTVEVHLTKGGLDEIRVIDDGHGMPKDDLELCFLPHATSKIRDIADLDTVYTLGFRGEALSSVSACARLEVVSRTRDSDLAHRLEVQDGHVLALEPFRGKPGTRVVVTRLFHDIPARKRFLKSAQAETTLCKNAFVEKALAYPDRHLRLFTDGKLKFDLPAGNRETRIQAVYDSVIHPSTLNEVRGSGEGFSFDLYVGGPSYFRRDRRYLQAFVNGRRVQEYALIQAIEYGFNQYLPGGSYPYGFLFLNIDPALADFNIHPAKREVRFRNKPEIHHAITDALKEFLSNFALRVPSQESSSPDWFAPPPGSNQRNTAPPPPLSTSRTFPHQKVAGTVSERPASTWVLPEKREVQPPPSAADNQEFTYLGQVFRLYLAAELGGTLYLVDQHAAHERIIFESLKEDPRVQKLLVPVEIPVSPDEMVEMKRKTEALRKMGFEIEYEAEDHLKILAVPEYSRNLERELVEFLRGYRGTEADLETELYATASCKAAVKDGEVLDDMTALSILSAAFRLDNARCPHGRPIWYAITSDELSFLVGRT